MDRKKNLHASRLVTISQAFRCFDEVARRGSVRQAAPALHLTAAAVNQQILNLEQQVGVALFDRLPRGMQLTEAGEIVLAAVRRSQRDLESALTEVEDLQSLRRGHISIGVSHSSAEGLIPGVVESILADHPGLTFRVRCGTGEELLRWTANGEIDVAYCLRRRAPPGIDEVRSWPHRLGVVTAPTHPLVQRPLIQMRHCLEYPVVLMAADMELRTLMERLDTRLLKQGRPLMETGSIPLARHLVRQGRAITFLIPENVVDDVAQGQLVWTALEDANALAHACLYQRTGFVTSHATRLFLEALGAAVEDIQRRFDSQRAVDIQSVAV